MDNSGKAIIPNECLSKVTVPYLYPLHGVRIELQAGHHFVEVVHPLLPANRNAKLWK